MIPETLVSIKIAKKHLETIEMKDRIIKESLDLLLLYYANNSKSISYPELIFPATIILRKFKKNTSNSNYKKMIGNFLEILNSN
jgi:nucleolar complex protein 2